MRYNYNAGSPIVDPSLVFNTDFAKHDGSSFMSDDHYGRLYLITGATWRPDGRSFDGTDDIINNATTAFQLPIVTVMGWFYANSTQTQGDDTVGIWSYGGAVNDRIQLNVITPQSAPTLQLYDDINDANIANNLGTITMDTFHHFAVISDATGKSAYVDGVQKLAPDSTSTTFADLSSSRLMLGNYVSTAGSPSTTGYLTGKIGEFLIYNRTLTLPEIQYHQMSTKWRY